MAKVFFKKLLLALAGYTGLLGLIRFFNRKKIVIFMLHGVVEEKEYPWQPIRQQCSLKRYEQVLTVLRKYFQFVTLDDAVAMISGEKPIRPYCAVLTFDDGYRNNFITALPYLKKHSIPATFFIPTGHITKQNLLWFDAFDYAIQYGAKESFSFTIDDTDTFFDMHDQGQVKKQFHSFLSRYNTKFQANDFYLQQEIFLQIDQLQLLSGASFSSVLREDSRTALMNWEEVEQTCLAGGGIGSHSVDHLKLSTLDRQQIKGQLQESKKDIEEHVKKSCKYLCYPNGDFNDCVIQTAIECGYKAAVTIEPNLNEVGEDLFRLYRIGLPRRADQFHVLQHIYGNSGNPFEHLRNFFR